MVPWTRWLPTIVGKVTETARSIEVLHRAGLISFPRLYEGVSVALAARRIGPFAAVAGNAARHDQSAVALMDERGPLTFSELDLRSNALARALADRGVRAGTVLATLCRDHRGLVTTMLASGKLGARLVLLNTGFATPQLVDVARRERVEILVHDEEFSDAATAMPSSVRRYLAWAEQAVPSHTPSLEELIVSTGDQPLPPPARPGGFVLLTSGTTGTPKGAARERASVLASAQFLDRIPLRPKESTFIAAPLFHGTGISQFVLSFALGSTVVLRRRFDPEATLAAVQEHRCTALVLVPTMLQRIVDLRPEVLSRYDTSSLRIVFVAGSALSPDLGNRTMEAFGDVLYNLYGSTEVAVATVATPEDWRKAPGTAGKPPVGCRVALYDEHRKRVTKPGATGRIFVGSGLSLRGYSDGARHEVIDGLLETGDIGHFDADGLLFIDGRDDDMIVSGGENVFPAEVENLLMALPDVREAAVIGVPDDEFGQRLKAFVVPAPGVSPSAEEIRAHVKANSARYKVPRDVEFVDSLLHNATGKVVRTQLR